MYRLAVSVSIGLIVLTGGVTAFLFLRGGMADTFENAPISVAPLREEVSISPVPEEVQSPRDTDTSLTLVEKAPSPTKELPPPLEDSQLEIRETLIAFGYRVPPSPRSIDTIVVHSSYNASGGDVYDIEKIIRQYEDYGVGAHYLIGRKGTIFRLVEEKNIAYHAGVAKMPDGRTNVNDFSIGIELVGTEKSGFTREQYESLNTLLVDIKGRYTIKNTVGHSDIAPGRKTDPWEFDWTKLK